MKDRRVGANIHPWIKGLPVGHLQLVGSERGGQQPQSTIGDLLDAVAAGALSHSSATVARKIRRTLNTLDKTVAGGRLDNWDRFRTERPPLRSYKALYFASPRLRGLSPQESGAPAGKLHLSQWAINALRRGRITTIGQLIRRAQNGIVNFAGLGLDKGLELLASLDALSDAVQPDGSVDWLKFAQLRGFRILPSTLSGTTPHEFLREFRDLCGAAVRSKFGGTALKVFRSQLLRKAGTRQPRTRIAQMAAKTRETVRLYENKIVRMLRDAIWQDEYSGCTFRFRREFLQPFLNLRKCLRKIPKGECRPWENALQECWGVHRGALSQQEILLLRLLGSDAPPLRREFDLARRVAIEARRFAAKNRTRSFTEKEVWQHLLAQKQLGAPNRRSVTAILKAMPNLSRVSETGSFRVAFRDLSYVERCEATLRDRGAPMHRREIAAAIGETAAKPHDLALTSGILTSSKRFVPIGKTGLWGLAEWGDLETRTVADIAAEQLAASNRPMNELELFASIKVRRPLAFGSVGSLLRNDGRFRKIAPRTWVQKEAAGSCVAAEMKT